MATKELVSNLKLITSGNMPTTANLANGELAFGLVGGVTKLYGNVNGTIVDFSNFVEALACDVNKDFSAGENGKVCIGSIPVYDNNITIDISCTTADTYHGTLVIATQNYHIQSAVMYGDENNMLAPLVKIEHTERIVTVYCAFPDWSKNQVHIKVTPKQGEVTRVLERVAEIPTTNLYNFTKALTFPVTSVAGKSGAVTLSKSDVGLGNVDNVKQYSASNPPPYPVTSVNGKTGAVVIDTGGTPYVTTISSWSGSRGNYYSTISASTHGKGAYPSVHTYVQNGSLWEETYDSPAIDAKGNVTIYTNSSISIKVVIK